jgi:putative heme iron utilization protein
MSDTLTPQVSDRICKHMNEDHADAVLMYAQIYGQLAQASSATMDAIDPEGMNLTALVDGDASTVRVTFDHTLTDSEDAHQTLIAMIRQARSAK